MEISTALWAHEAREGLHFSNVIMISSYPFRHLSRMVIRASFCIIDGSATNYVVYNQVESHQVFWCYTLCLKKRPNFEMV